jgi:hypothetical protein
MGANYLRHRGVRGMRRTQIFPYIMCILSIGASIMYVIEPGHWRQATYWAAAAVIAFVLAT